MCYNYNAIRNFDMKYIIQNYENKNSKSLVICHLFYQDMWDKIYGYLKNLEEIKAFDLYITLAQWNEELVQRIKKSFNSNINISVQIVNNPAGADIHPFIHILNQVNLDNYDIVFKLHTKRTIIGNRVRLPDWTGMHFYIGNGLWFDFLYNAILGKSNVKQVVEKFDKEPKIGCIAFKPLVRKVGYDKIQIQKLTKDNVIAKEINPDICYGTIFAIRSKILKNIQHCYTDEDFKPDRDAKSGNYSDKFCQRSWFFEYYLGYIVYAQGYEFGYVGFKNKLLLELFAHRITLPLYNLFVKTFVLK